jgi:hypothetical protein
LFGCEIFFLKKKKIQNCEYRENLFSEIMFGWFKKLKPKKEKKKEKKKKVKSKKFDKIRV